MSAFRPSSWPGDHPLFQQVAPEVLELGEGRASMSIHAPEEFANRVPGGMNGGAYALFGACAAELAAATTVSSGEWAEFLELRVQIYRPLLAGDVAHMAATVRHRGKRFLSVSVEMACSDGRLCAEMSASMGIASTARLLQAPPERPTRLRVDEAGEQPATGQAWRHFGVTVLEAGELGGKVTVDAGPRFNGTDLRPHQAMLAFAADQATPPTFMHMAQEGKSASTIEYKVNFLRPAAPGPLTAISSVLHSTGDTLVEWVVVQDVAGAECAVMLTTLAMIRRSD